MAWTPVVGDVVRGRGYNIDHEIVGKVISVQPGTDHCNLTIVCIAAPSPIFRDADGTIQVRTTREYGDAALFDKVA